jgi:hypothetical protein
MARLTKAEAARQMGISRTTLYKLIHAGTLSVHPDGTIDTAELVRAVSILTPSVQRERLNVHPAHHGVYDVDSEIIDDEHDERSHSVHREHREQVSTERQLTSTYRELVDTLREQLQAAREREKNYQARIAWLEQHVDQIQQRYDRLLEAPRPSTPAAGPRTPPPVSTRQATTPDTWQRILDYMQQHLDPQGPQDVQQALGWSHTARHIMKRMADAGKLTRVGPGRYRLAETPRGEREQ